MSIQATIGASHSAACPGAVAVLCALALFAGAGTARGDAPGASAPEGPARALRAAGERPRIGLVLSGGGARGAAHIGVLRVLEELRVPVDYLTGNSMGAVVGGLYAAGYSAEELERILDAIDWRTEFSDRPPRNTFTYRRKQDDREFLTKVRVGIKGFRLQFPRGMIEGQRLETDLRFLFLGARASRDFREFPIPFRAVATDLENGETAVFDQGDPAVVVRASMSVPGAFAPVGIDGRLLVDGMISNNIPIDQAKDMGADIVIAVDVGTPLLTDDQIGSLFDVSAQVLNLLMKQTTDRQLALLGAEDVLITPELGSITSADFVRMDEAIPLGVEAADRERERLAAFSLSPEGWEAHLADRASRRSSAPLPFLASVEVDNNSVMSDRALTGRVRVQPGDRFDPDALRADLERLYGMGIFERVKFRLEPGEVPQEARLRIIAEERGWGPHYLKLALGIEEDFTGDTRYSVGFNYTMNPVNRLGAEVRNIVRVGTDQHIFSEFYQPLTAEGQLFVAPAVAFSTRTLNVPVAPGDLEEFDQWQFGGAFDVGAVLGNVGEFRVGIQRFFGRTGPSKSLEDFHSTRFDTGGLEFELGIDTLDAPYFMTRGSRLQLNFILDREWIGADDNQDILRFLGLQAVSYRENTMLLVAQGTVNFSDGFSPSRFQALGGLFRLSGFGTNAFAGPQALLFEAMFYRKIADPRILSFDLPVYLGFSVEGGNVFPELDDIELDEFLLAGSAFLGVDTWFGPLFLAYGYGEGGHHTGYLFLGQRF